MRVRSGKEYARRWAEGLARARYMECRKCGRKTRMDKHGWWKCRWCGHPGSKVKVR